MKKEIVQRLCEKERGLRGYEEKVIGTEFRGEGVKKLKVQGNSSWLVRCEESNEIIF